MKRKRFTEDQIIGALDRHGTGLSVEDICRDLGIAHGTFYRWKYKYCGMSVSEAKRLKELESENTRLKQMLADAMLFESKNRAWLQQLSTH